MATRTATIIVFCSLLIGPSALLHAQNDPPPPLGAAGLPELAEIQTWVKYWVGRIAKAETEAEIVEARRKLVSGYQRFEPATYRYDYADTTATEVSAALKTLPAGDLKALREINAASALGVFDQVSVQFALQELVAHDNPGVRYWGWKGLAGIRDLSLAQGGQTAEAFFTVITQRSAAETSAVVLGAMWEAMVLPVSSPDGVDAVTWGNAVDTFANILNTNWANACGQVASGDASWVGAAPKAVMAMVRLARIAGDDEIQTPLGHLLHMTFAAFRAYDAAPADTEREQHAIVLLARCEAALAGLSGLSVSPGLEATLIDPSYQT